MQTKALPCGVQVDDGALPVRWGVNLEGAAVPVALEGDDEALLWETAICMGVRSQIITIEGDLPTTLRTLVVVRIKVAV